MTQIMKKTATMWEYKVGNNAIIANFMCMWKSRITSQLQQLYLRNSNSQQFQSKKSQLQGYFTINILQSAGKCSEWLIVTL